MELIEIPINSEADIVTARNKMRFASQKLGFNQIDQIRIATAASELTRDVYESTGEGSISLSVFQKGERGGIMVTCDYRQNSQNMEQIFFSHPRPKFGINPDGGIASVGRLIDQLNISDQPNGENSVTFVKWLPEKAINPTSEQLIQLRAELVAYDEESAIAALKLQNQELLQVLAELRDKSQALEIANAQLSVANEKLSVANHKLSEITRLKDEFLSTTTHDLKSPLMVLQHAVELFKDGLFGELSSEQEEMLEMMERSQERLLNLVNDVLEASRLESGKVVLDPMPMSVQILIDPILDEFAILAEEKNIQIVSHIEPDLPEIEVDPDRFPRVLSNLIYNAIKFTPAGGKITVVCQTTKMADSVLIKVSDTGVGIPKDEIPKLFEKYHQVKLKSQQDGESGTGLGLYVCQQLVQLHGGKIRVESELRKGTTFLIQLPSYNEID